MESRKTPYGWMALGGLVGLLGVVAVSKFHDTAKVTAQSGAPSAGPIFAHAPMKQKESVKQPTVQPTPLPISDLPPLEVSPNPAPSAGSFAEPVPPATVAPLPTPSGFPAPPAPVAPPSPSGTLIEVPMPAPVSSVPAAPEPAAPSVSIPAPVPEKASDVTLPPPLPANPSVPPPPLTEVKPMPVSPPVPTGDPLPPLASPEIKQVSLNPAPLPAPAPPIAKPVDPLQVPDAAPAAKYIPTTEPPLAPSPGPVVLYAVPVGGETMREIARRTLGSVERWQEVQRLNPSLAAEGLIAGGTTVKLPGDACIHDEQGLHPLPVMRPKATLAKSKTILPLTGTYAVNFDEKKTLQLPKAIREQLGNCDTVLLSPGSDQCLWLTNQCHLDRLADRLEHSPAREIDVRTFKRLYFAQTEKAAISDDGMVTVPEKLAQFAALHQELVLIGIDDHFELWDAGKWRQYTLQKSAAARAAMAD